MKTDIKKIFQLILLILIVVTLAFIYIQSLIPPEKSTEQSGAVGDILEEIIPPETKPGEFVQNNVRKIAHFVEFSVLGCLVSLYLVIYHREGKHIFSSFIFGIISAFFDETLQYISNRGPSVSDVWLDFAGFVFSSVILYTVCLLVYIIKQNCKQ